MPIRRVEERTSLDVMDVHSLIPVDHTTMATDRRTTNDVDITDRTGSMASMDETITSHTLVKARVIRPGK
jgi:pyruvate/2-oxoglutarate/acetoin dehydrogenase E1 component